MEFRQLEIFLTAAREENFSRAAEALFLPQSVVSEQIGRLERELGVKLFDRSHRAVRLTTEGRTTVDLASTVMRDVGKLRREVGSGRETKGLVTISLAIGKGMTERITKVANALRAEKVQLEIMEAKPAQRVSLVKSSQVNAAILRGRRAGAMDDSKLICEDCLVAAVNRAHESFGSSRISLESLRHTPMALTARQRNPMLVDLVAQAFQVDPKLIPRAFAFSTVEAAFAQISICDKPAWVPIYEDYESQHEYQGIWSAPIDPPLTVPVYLIPGSFPSAAQTNAIRLLLKFCRHFMKRDA